MLLLSAFFILTIDGLLGLFILTWKLKCCLQQLDKTSCDVTLRHWFLLFLLFFRSIAWHDLTCMLCLDHNHERMNMLLRALRFSSFDHRSSKWESVETLSWPVVNLDFFSLFIFKAQRGINCTGLSNTWHSILQTSGGWRQIPPFARECHVWSQKKGW